MEDHAKQENDLAGKTAIAELNKLELEIELLKREKQWFWLKLPALTTLVAACGILVTVWQFQKTELARIDERKASIQNETKERVNKIQGQIREDKQQLAEFENDPKISSVQAGFIIDDLKSLVRQLPEGQSEEEPAIAEHLRRIVWALRFDDRRHFDFDVSTLRRWNANREYWRLNPQSHHLFLARKYHSRIEKLQSCFEQITHQGETIDYRNMAESCNEELIGALIYGFMEHLQVAKESSETELGMEIDQFVLATHNRILGDELKRQVQARRN